MEDLIQQEKFEIEVLEYLNSGKFLDRMVFLGGTMMRLCYGLNRFSVDLDFWIIKEINVERFFEEMKSFLKKKYIIRDCADKFHTMLFEIGSSRYPRHLKIEIRKVDKKIKYEKTIAFSKFSNIQVLVNSITLEDMLNLKVESFLDRKEIRDCFDIEFLLKRGLPLTIEKEQAIEMTKIIRSFKENDYKVKLGSILEKKERDYYIRKNFEFLKMELKRIIEDTNFYK